tara:strand:+ start:1288 stop:2079 length:792 start_codon:yes stop_codon:yes gene_type:complete
MKKYFVIGNPIEHSLSPKLHNYWLAQNKIEAIYDKKLITKNDLEGICDEIRKNNINGLNITVPFKKEIIPFLDHLSQEAEETQSVNTVYMKNDKIIGHNTDIEGFELNIKNIKFNASEKKIFIIGAGGVVPSLIFALKRMKVTSIIISNRTKQNAENLKKLFKDLTIVDWGEIPDFDMVINATSIGLKEEDLINLDFSKSGKNKFFYDVIYNPKSTKFLSNAKKSGHKIENGKMMFIYQACAAFEKWHNIRPQIDTRTIELLD